MCATLTALSANNIMLLTSNFYYKLIYVVPRKQVEKSSTFQMGVTLISAAFGCAYKFVALLSAASDLEESTFSWVHIEE